MISVKKLVNVSLFCLLAFIFVSCSAPKQEASSSESEVEFQSSETLEVRTLDGVHYIAIASPLTGPYRELGNTIVEAATLAVEDFNENLEDKHRIGTIIIDDGGLVSEGIARASLVAAQEALGVIGHLNSEISIEVSNIYTRSKIPSISPASTNPKLTERPQVKGYVFRTIGTDRQMGEKVAEFVQTKEELKRVAVLYNDRPYGVSVASEFVREIAKDDTKELVLYQTIPVRTSDHVATASKIATAKADVVFFIGEYNDAGYLLKEIKAKSPNVHFIGAEGVHHQEFISIAGNASEGAYIIGSSPAAETVSAKYQQRYGKPATGYVGSAYRATMVLLDAIKENKFKDTTKIAQTIASNKLFDPNGDLIKPGFVMYQVKDGNFSI